MIQGTPELFQTPPGIETEKEHVEIMYRLLVEDRGPLSLSLAYTCLSYHTPTDFPCFRIGKVWFILCDVIITHLDCNIPRLRLWSLDVPVYI